MRSHTPTCALLLAYLLDPIQIHVSFSELKNLHIPRIQPKYESYKKSHIIWYGLQRPYYMGHMNWMDADPVLIGVTLYFVFFFSKIHDHICLYLLLYLVKEWIYSNFWTWRNWFYVSQCAQYKYNANVFYTKQGKKY